MLYRYTREWQGRKKKKLLFSTLNSAKQINLCTVQQREFYPDAYAINVRVLHTNSIVLPISTIQNTESSHFKDFFITEDQN